MMEATGDKEAGGVNGISMLVLVGLSETLAGPVALAAEVGPIDGVFAPEVGASVDAVFASEVGIDEGISDVAPVAVVAPVGVGVFPVPTEDPSVGVMPEGVVTVVGPAVGGKVGVPSDVGMAVLT